MTPTSATTPESSSVAATRNAGTKQSSPSPAWKRHADARDDRMAAGEAAQGREGASARRPRAQRARVFGRRGGGGARAPPMRAVCPGARAQQPAVAVGGRLPLSPVVAAGPEVTACTFYDDPELAYTVDRRVTGWDAKRAEWLWSHGLAGGAEPERVVMVWSQLEPCRGTAGDHLLLRFLENKPQPKQRGPNTCS
ncbi:hypothetical protein ACP70R_008253 [Stipagrostis hirtigluma subsp. patula]